MCTPVLPGLEMWYLVDFVVMCIYFMDFVGLQILTANAWLCWNFCKGKNTRGVGLLP